MNVRTLHLSPTDLEALDRLLEELLCRRSTVSIVEALENTRLLSDELPRHVRQVFSEFKLHQREAAISIKGYPINDASLGPTPIAIPGRDTHRTATREEIVHLLFAARLGEVFTWSSMQNANIFNEIVPIKSDEQKAISSGSSSTFDLHTEDAFHECAGDFLGLVCLRNPSNHPILMVDIDDLELPADVRRILFEDRFRIEPNIAHGLKTVGSPGPIFFGNPQRPSFRVNLNRMSTLAGDERAELALESLVKEMRAECRHFSLAPGEFLFINNMRVAHGREPYLPRYDGFDRWLKRLYITSDLRRSAHLRSNPESRVIELGRET